MSTITVTLTDENLEKLRQRAAESMTAPEDLIRAAVEEWLSRPAADFASAAEYVLRKNADLYRRLA